MYSIYTKPCQLLLQQCVNLTLISSRVKMEFMHASSGSARVNAFSLLVQTSDEASVKKMIRDMFSEYDTATKLKLEMR